MTSGMGRSGPGAGVRPRILLVEDHADTCRAVRRLLELSGCEVASAHSLGQARAICGPGPCGFDLLVCDLQLPDGDGRELMRELRGAARPAASPSAARPARKRST